MNHIFTYGFIVQLLKLAFVIPIEKIRAIVAKLMTVTILFTVEDSLMPIIVNTIAS